MKSEWCTSPFDHLKSYFKDSIPSIILELQGGLSSAKNYKITIDHHDYVLRVLNPSISIEVRQQEANAAMYAGERGIGPHVFYIDSDYNALIMDFVSGKTLDFSVVNDQEKLYSLLQTIKQLHKSTGQFPKGLTVFERIELQVERLKQTEIPFPSKSIQDALSKLKYLKKIFDQEPLVPCHNDLNALNIIFNEDIFKVIDWSDAGMGHVFNDLGFFALVNCMGKEGDCKILNLYLGRVPSKKELDLLRYMKKVNALRIFSKNFPPYEAPIKNEKERAERMNELEKMVWSRNLFGLDHYLDLHIKGQLNSRELVISTALSALRAFLDMD